MDLFLLIFIMLIGYIFLLFIIRKLGVGKKRTCSNCNNCCPDCRSALNRIKRSSVDHLTHHITFRIFDARRYFCNECGWEGLRWEDTFRPGLD